MAKNIERIAAGLGADIIGQLPHTGAGVFGAARLAWIVEIMQARLVPGQAVVLAGHRCEMGAASQSAHERRDQATAV